jgi:hypothetical protein
MMQPAQDEVSRILLRRISDIPHKEDGDGTDGVSVNLLYGQGEGNGGQHAGDDHADLIDLIGHSQPLHPSAARSGACQPCAACLEPG